MKTILAVLCILAFPFLAGADCRVVRQRAVHHVAPVAAVFAPVVAIPAYSVSYNPGLAEELTALKQEVQQLRQALTVPQTLPQKAEPEFVSMLRANCAACHTAGSEKGKLSLFQGEEFKQPTPQQLGDIIAAVANGRMPKGRQMNPQDRLKLIGGITGGDK